MNSWNDRPKDLKPDELLAWALCEVADALGGLDGISVSLDDMVRALRALGVGNASTDMGAIEFLATQIRNGLDDLNTTYLTKGNSNDD